MAGLEGEVDFEDALGVASLMVAAGRVPPPAAWVDALIEQKIDETNDRFAESFF